MPTLLMNNTLVETCRRADGRYFSDAELTALETYFSTYPLRLQTYSILSEKSEMMIRQVMAKLTTLDAEVVKEHGSSCVRDMSFALRTVGLAILKDDREGFRQEFVLWMQNIMASLHKEAQSARAYRLLQEVVQANMPTPCVRLVNDYLDEFIRALML